MERAACSGEWPFSGGERKYVGEVKCFRCAPTPAIRGWVIEPRQSTRSRPSRNLMSRPLLSHGPH